VLGFFGVDPFAANNVGVKLGESTFNPFLFDERNTVSTLSLDIDAMFVSGASVGVLTYQFGFDSVTLEDRD
jgi:hypothetical protein